MSFATAWTLWSGLLFGQADLLPTQAPLLDQRPLASGTLVFGQPVSQPAPLPESPSAPLPAIALPAETTPEQRAHIEQAMKQLRAGGLTGIANQLEAALHAARQDELKKALEEKQAQLQTLQREVAELQKRLQTSEPIAFRFTMLKVDRDQLRKADPVLARQLTMRMQARGGSVIQPDPVTTPLDVAELLKQLCTAKDSGAISILSQPTVLTHDGQEAKLHSGGQFPILVPQTAGEPTTEYRDFGTIVTVRPRVVASNVVHCFAVYEQADLNFDHAVVMAGGTKIPGITKRRMAAQFTAKFGETILFPTSETGPMVTLVFATVEHPDNVAATPILPNPPMNQVEPEASATVSPHPVGKEVSYPAWMAPPGPSSPPPQQPWISPVQLLMRTLLETDTDRFIPPATLDVDVKYYLAPPLPQPQPQPAALPQPVPAPQQ